MVNRFISLLICLLPLIGYGAVWNVGPSRTFKKPSEVAGRVANGDTVLIDAGLYMRDVCTWRAHKLYVKGVNGKAHLNADGIAQSGKAIWVVAGDSMVIENIEFSNCRVPDKNGAGIRLEGTHLVVRSCYFHDNETGILAGDNIRSHVLVEFTEFNKNGFGDGFSHNIYINHLASLTFRYNYSHRAFIGHELKSRAHINQILYNQFSNEDGRASFEIDLPNGGPALIMGNILQQAVQGENGGMISYGKEGLTNPGPHNVFIIHNTMVSERSLGTLLHLQNNSDTLVLLNNIIGGNLNLMTGMSAFSDLRNNLIEKNIDNIFFVDRKKLDYHISGNSPARSGAVISPYIYIGRETWPQLEYVFHSQCKPRHQDAVPDIGAFEYDGVNFTRDINSGIYLYKLGNTLYLIPPENDDLTRINLTITDVAGKVVADYSGANIHGFSNDHLPVGIYFVIHNNRCIYKFIR